MKKIVITIDGPAGAGKTTVSKTLANRLGYTYVDTGALYRGIAFAVKESTVDPDDIEALRRLCETLSIKLVNVDNRLQLICNGKDITGQIRTPEITMLASAVSARKVVRDFLLQLQRDLAHDKGVVFEGRDMGTVVFPSAEAKFFLDASPEQRALRRYKELSHTKGLTYEKVRDDLVKRDQNDSTRDIAPLRPADDAVILDSTSLTIEQVVDQIMMHVTDRLKKE